jgi:hypothetical protein
MLDVLILMFVVFVGLICCVMLWKRTFRRDDWDAALERSREAVALSRAVGEAAGQETRDRYEAKAAERKAKHEVWKEEKRLQYEDRKAAYQARIDARGEAVSKARSTKPIARRRSYHGHEDTALGGMIGGVAAASLIDDIDEAFGNQPDQAPQDDPASGDWDD